MYLFTYLQYSTTCNAVALRSDPMRLRQIKKIIFVDFQVNIIYKMRNTYATNMKKKLLMENCDFLTQSCVCRNNLQSLYYIFFIISKYV